MIKSNVLKVFINFFEEKTTEIMSLHDDVTLTHLCFTLTDVLKLEQPLIGCLEQTKLCDWLIHIVNPQFE